jgi:hypothetical protein
VVHASVPKTTSKGDWYINLKLVDESKPDMNFAFTVNVFSTVQMHVIVPTDIVVIERLVIQTHGGKLQGMAGKRSTLHVYHLTQQDVPECVQQLQHYYRTLTTTLVARAPPLPAITRELVTLDQLRLDGFYDIVCHVLRFDHYGNQNITLALTDYTSNDQMAFVDNDIAIPGYAHAKLAPNYVLICTVWDEFADLLRSREGDDFEFGCWLKLENVRFKRLSNHDTKCEGALSGGRYGGVEVLADLHHPAIVAAQERMEQLFPEQKEVVTALVPVAAVDSIASILVSKAVGAVYCVRVRIIAYYPVDDVLVHACGVCGNVRCPLPSHQSQGSLAIRLPITITDHDEGDVQLSVILGDKGVWMLFQQTAAELETAKLQTSLDGMIRESVSLHGKVVCVATGSMGNLHYEYRMIDVHL